MDLNVRFWNESRNIVETRYYDSKFLEKTNAENLFQSVKDASNGLRREKVLQLAMDGPNVNWEVLKRQIRCWLEIITVKRLIQEVALSILFTVPLKLVLLMIEMYGKFLKVCCGYDSPACRNTYVTEDGSDVFPMRYY